MSDFTSKYFNKYWMIPIAVLFVPLLMDFIRGEDVTIGLLLRLGILLFCAAAYFVGIKLLHLNKSEPLPLYASPLVWLGIPVFCVIAYKIFV